MHKIVLSALFALGLGLAGATGASAAPVAAGYSPAATAPLIEQIQYRPYRYHRRHRYCYNVRRCWRGYHGRRVCRVQRVCHWRR